MTVKITKPSINVREKLSELDKETGIKGEELLRADTSAEAREALQLDQQLFTDFESTGIDDNATSTAITLDSSGNLLVGRTTDANTNGLSLLSSGFFRASTTSTTTGVFNRNTSNGAILGFSKDGTTVGSISSNSSSYIAIGSDDTGILFYDSGDAVTPFNTTTQANAGGALDLGHSAIRWRNLYLSGGVYLGGTGAANLLDDYEEGTWTPIFQNVTVTYSVQSGTYTKVGNLVTCSGTITAAYIDNTDASSFAISGMPFSVQTNSFSSGTLNVPYNTTTRLLNTTARNVTGVSVDGVSAYASDASEQNYERYTDICNASGTVYFTFTYRTA